MSAPPTTTRAVTAPDAETDEPTRPARTLDPQELETLDAIGALVAEEGMHMLEHLAYVIVVARAQLPIDDLKTAVLVWTEVAEDLLLLAKEHEDLRERCIDLAHDAVSCIINMFDWIERAGR